MKICIIDLLKIINCYLIYNLSEFENNVMKTIINIFDSMASDLCRPTSCYERDIQNPWLKQAMFTKWDGKRDDRYSLLE
jgi:hypothetical protein